MTAPTIPPQQPEPEQVCGNCEFYRSNDPCERLSFGTCVVASHLPRCFRVLNMDEPDTRSFNTCVLFRASKES